MASAIDLFCGAGGLTHGLESAGIKVKAGVDIDPACRFPFEENNSACFIQKDVFDLSGDSLRTHWDNGTRILVGCAPCQTFSTYSMGKKKADPDDKRWSLIAEYARIVGETLPEIVSMENVPRAGKSEAFLELVSLLKSEKYHVWYDIVNCADFGVPQNRNRLVLLASQFGPLELQRPQVTHVSVRVAISHLEPIENGTASKTDPLHYASKLSPLNAKRVVASKPGGSWKDWPEELHLACHRKASGKTYRSVYGRMRYDEPAPTLTTHCLGVGNGRFIHPEQDRGLSIREASLLQSFPSSYKFVEDGGQVRPKVLARLIGNAVPVFLAKSIGNAIVNHLSSYETRNPEDETKSSAILMH